MIHPKLMADGSNSNKRGKEDRQGQTAVLGRPKLKRPPLYKVILLNDDYTTQEFVDLILRKFFQKNNSIINFPSF